MVAAANSSAVDQIHLAEAGEHDTGGRMDGDLQHVSEEEGMGALKTLTAYMSQQSDSGSSSAFGPGSGCRHSLRGRRKSPWDHLHDPENGDLPAMIFLP